MKKLIVGSLCVVATFALAGCGAEAPEPLGQVSQPVIPASCSPEVSGATNYWISPCGNDVTGDGTFGNPTRTLKKLHDQVITNPTSDIFIHVADGTYPAEETTWTKFPTSKKITIEACPDAVPVFDGLLTKPADPTKCDNPPRSTPASRFLALDPSSNGDTNVILRGLTFRNFYSKGIILNLESDPPLEDIHNSNNIVDSCTFENIGNRLWSSQSEGFAAIQMERSSNNTITNNTFVKIENDEAFASKVHAVYVATDSDSNRIEGNSVDRCSGAPITFRDGSDDNIVANNYFNRAGVKSIVGAWYSHDLPGECLEPEEPRGTPLHECKSLRNAVYGNVATYPHEFAAGSLSKCLKGPTEECGEDEVDFTVAGEEPNLFELAPPDSEQVAAVLGGDFDHDGVDEVVAAFNYDGNYGGFTKVVSTAGSIGNRHFHRVLYANGGEGEDFFWDVAKLVAGDFDDDGDVELLTAFHADTATYVYKGDGVSHLEGCTEPGSIYSDTSSPYFRVTGMAAGNFDSDAADEVVTAFEKSDNTTIDSGDGISSLTNGAAYFTNETAPYWHVTAMSAGNFNGTGRDEVITAMNKQGSSPVYKVYSTNDTTSITNLTLHTSSASPFWITTATVGGDFNANGPDEPITGMYSGANYRLYRGNGTTTVAGTALPTPSQPFYIRALGSGYFDAGTNLDLVTAIEQPGRAGDDVRIYVGNGWSDYDDFWELYSSDHND